MNSKMSSTLQAASLALMLLWSAGVNADQTNIEAATAAERIETRELAVSAHHEAVSDALIRISASTRLDLDVELPTRISAPVSGD